MGDEIVIEDWEPKRLPRLRDLVDQEAAAILVAYDEGADATAAGLALLHSPDFNIVGWNGELVADFVRHVYMAGFRIVREVEDE